MTWNLRGLESVHVDKTCDTSESIPGPHIYVLWWIYIQIYMTKIYIFDVITQCKKKMHALFCLYYVVIYEFKYETKMIKPSRLVLAGRDNYGLNVIEVWFWDQTRKNFEFASRALELSKYNKLPPKVEKLSKWPPNQNMI